jgi:hypothetical protein
MKTSDTWALALSFAAIGVPALLFARWWRGPLTFLGVKTAPDRPRAFGYKSTWLAVKAASADEVVQALRAAGLAGRSAAANWESGFERAYGPIGGRTAFVSPPVDGWVFVLNAPLERREDLDRIAKLSGQLGRPVYGFGSHRGVGAALWVVADGGAVRRAWCVADGETIYDVGAVTPEEQALDISFGEPTEPDDERAERASDEATVIALAKAWTRDPTTLEQVTTEGVGAVVRLTA